jgi:hypothetical protein
MKKLVRDSLRAAIVEIERKRAQIQDTINRLDAERAELLKLAHEQTDLTSDEWKDSD